MKKAFLLTPLCEGRLAILGGVRKRIRISTHAPLRGATIPRNVPDNTRTDFYSRPSARGDLLVPKEEARSQNFYSRPSARGDSRGDKAFVRDEISTHAPLRGATWYRWMMLIKKVAFLLTPLCEGRLEISGDNGNLIHISTHAPLRGATVFAAKLTPMLPISTHAPLRGATYRKKRSGYKREISTHAPLRGATSGRCKRASGERFLLTPLCEGRLEIIGHNGNLIHISTHAPLRGATCF